MKKKRNPKRCQECQEYERVLFGEDWQDPDRPSFDPPPGEKPSALDRVLYHGMKSWEAGKRYWYRKAWEELKILRDRLSEKESR